MKCNLVSGEKCDPAEDHADERFFLQAMLL